MQPEETRKKRLSSENDINTPNLPYEIIENILSRLPVESLLRFKSVSNSWFSIISDTKFAKFHLHQSNKSSHKIYIGSDLTLKADHFTCLNDSVKLLKLRNQKLQIKPLKEVPKSRVLYAILCSCDGLVLLSNTSTGEDNMCIWNPCTRAYTKFTCNYDILRDKCIFGFCYNASNDDYKVVISISEIRYAIYSFKNYEWIDKEDCSSSLSEILQYPRSGILVHGSLHWIGCENKGALQKTYKICCFDPKDDKFKKLSMLPSWFDINFSLIELRGELCLYSTDDEVGIWMMKEYGDCESWNKILSIKNERRYETVKPLCLTNENNVVFHIRRAMSLAIYNPTKNLVIVEKTCLSVLCLDGSLILPSRSS